MIIKSKGLNVNYLGESEVFISEGEKKKAKFYELLPLLELTNNVSHHILLIDTSASMESEIPKLKEKVKDILRALKASDNHYVSIIRYAGHEESYRILGGVKCDNLSYKMGKVYEIVEEQLFAKGITVISEPLDKAIDIVTSLNEVCDKNHIVLFTDGCLVPMRWGVEEERKRCYQIAEICAGKGIYLNAIGFGKYYDRNFLKALMEFSTRGEWMHIDEVKDYYKTVLRFIQKVDDQYNTNISIENKDCYIFGLHERIKGGTVLSHLSNTSNVVVSFEEDLIIEGVKVSSTRQRAELNLIEDLYYELALYHLLREDLDSLVYVLAKTGDICAYESFYNIYSFVEKGVALEKLIELNESPNNRYKKGKVPIRIYSEEEEPLCLLEVIRDILEDEDSRLLWDYTYKYKRIGVKEKYEEGDYKFIRPEIGYGEVVDLSIGSKKLNIGVKVKIDGCVEEVATGFRIGASIYRDYNLVVNGNINTSQIWCELSKELVSKFRKAKIIKKVITIHDRKIYTLKLKNLKISNKRMFKMLNQQEVAQYLYDVEVLGIKKWAIKKLIDQRLQDFGKTAIDLENSDRIIKDLKKRFYIDEKGIYQPKKTKLGENLPYEVYPATILEWKIDKFPKKKLQEEALIMYSNLVDENIEESYIRLVKELGKIKREKREKESLINLVRLSVGIIGKPLFLWEEEYEKSKVETDKVLGINVVVDEKVHISTKVIGHIKIREDRYTILSRCTV